MVRIPTKAHGVLDYAGGIALLAAPSLLPLDKRSAALVRGAGAGVLAASSLTDYELGVKRIVPMKAHLALDAATGAFLAASPWVLRTKDEGILGWLPHLVLGAAEILGAAATNPVPGDRQAGAGTPGGAHGTGSPTVDGVSSPPDPASVGPAATAGAGAAPPPETPGPSVTPPEAPMSTTEREEHADELKPEHLPGDLDTGAPIDTLVADEGAATEAAMIGGPAPDEGPAGDDPAMRPVYEAGGGEQEGFEAAEHDLIENATHGDGGGDPLRDAFPPEAEAGDSGARYGDADNERVSEVTEDPGARESTGADDAADTGPGITHER